MNCNELKENDESSNVDANNSSAPESPIKSDEFQASNSSVFVGYSTPKARGVPMCYAETPENGVRNPFEGNPDEYLEKLSQTIVSPDMFSSSKRSNSETSKESPFWTIENISELNPALIDESSIYMQSSGLKLDPEKEEAAQKATISFFENNMNIPSPCTHPFSVKINCKPFISSPLAAPDSTPVGTRKPHKKDDAIHFSAGHSISRGTRLFVNTNCVSVQTDCSIPVDVDLSDLLSKYMTTTSDEPTTDVSFGNDSENSANSSLRRRLFSQKEEKEEEYYDSENEMPITSPSFTTPSVSSHPLFRTINESVCFKSPPRAQVLCKTPSKYAEESNYAESPILVVPGCKRLQDLGTPHRQTKRAMSPIEEQGDGFGHDLIGSPGELHDKPTLHCLSIMTSPGFSPITKK